VSIADAYENGAEAWSRGPARIYGPLADLLVAFSPEPIRAARVLDLGSGTGVGSHAAVAGGARVIATDLSAAMLRVDRARRPPSVAGDALALPFRARAFDVVLAPYHDVGMTAIKVASFGEAVNVTLGLPFVRTSPDHGTAFDIAGTGKANPASMRKALELAVTLSQKAEKA
jgi:SAM-dependent methyltransferase